ncbi:DUF4238 domain-containing protein [Nocardia sp. R6R-6]|uniref:DUF4238 domain-containing protein n=1 Tax=Nocardia sp. R6R-6 TaxID=3459303 RepID=UPI00403DF571
MPKFYLRGFADHRAWITTVRLPGEKTYTQSIDKSAAINHFYSIDGHPDGSDVFEKALSDLEGSDCFRAIEAGDWPLSEEQRVTLAMFLAVQYLRGPDHRRSMEYLAAHIARLKVEVTGRDNVADGTWEVVGADGWPVPMAEFVELHADVVAALVAVEQTPVDERLLIAVCRGLLCLWGPRRAAR